MAREFSRWLNPPSLLRNIYEVSESHAVANTHYLLIRLLEIYMQYDFIYTYTRQQALDDGVLIDASSMAKQAGFKVPVAITHAVHYDCVEWTEADSQRQTYQNASGRLWDLLFLARLSAGSDLSEVFFKLNRIPRNGKAKSPRLTTLKMQIHGGDSGEPVITIMEIGED